MDHYVIGLDFGNYNSFPCFIEGFDSETKLGGDVHRLIPPDLLYGIPSVYFYSKRRGTLLGFEAVTQKAMPLCNRLSYLKRQLGTTVTIEDKTIDINEAITELIQYCVRIANEQLLKEFGETTNRISLAYPVTYDAAKLEKLIELAEAGTLEDGTPIKVVGTIAEPAAVALDYLAVQHKTEKDTTVLVYDLGGESFDLALVAAYPKGRKDSAGDKRYYRIIKQDGLTDVGGVDFDKAMLKILQKKIKEELNGEYLTAREEERLRDVECEAARIELSKYDSTVPEITHIDELLDISVTRREFEAETEQLLMKTIKLTQKIIADNPNNKPEHIILAGDYCEMPMIENALKKYLPQYTDKIKKHKSEMAIACGAARYGTNEEYPRVHLRRLIRYDIGIRVFDVKSGKYKIDIFAKAGQEFPFRSKWHVSKTIADHQQTSVISVFEAVTDTPDPYNVDGDFRELMHVTVDHGKSVKKGTKTKFKIRIDRDGILRVYAFSLKNRSDICKCEVELKHIIKHIIKTW